MDSPKRLWDDGVFITVQRRPGDELPPLPGRPGEVVRGPLGLPPRPRRARWRDLVMRIRAGWVDGGRAGS